jgi:stage V sporulation protein B
MQDAPFDKATKLAKISASGSLYLFIGRVISTVISAIGTIILGSIILQADYGLYTIALIPLATLMLFQDWGIHYAVSRQCARCRANNTQYELRKIIVAGFTFALTVAALLTVISVVTANFIALTIFNQPNIFPLLIISSLTFLSSAIFAVSQSIFVGFENMKVLVMISLFQAIIQCVTAPVLVMLGYGALGVMIGYVLTSIVGGVVSIVIIYFEFYKKLPKSTFKFADILKELKPMLQYGVPLSIGTILYGLLPQFNSFIMASNVKDLTLIGNYQIATNFTVLLTFFSVPISTVLFPLFSKVNPKTEQDLHKKLFTSSIKYTSLLIVPATVILIVLSGPIISALYAGKWPYAHEYLSYLLLINLFVCLGGTTVTAFLSALGETKLMLLTNLVYLLTGIPIAIILIPWGGIAGMIIGLLLAGLPSVFISLYIIQKKFSFTVPYISSAKILLAAFFSGVLTYFIISQLAYSYWIQLALGFASFLAMYICFIPLLCALDKGDIVNLKAMFSGFGSISKILGVALNLIDKLLSIRMILTNRLKNNKKRMCN